MRARTQIRLTTLGAFAAVGLTVGALAATGAPTSAPEAPEAAPAGPAAPTMTVAAAHVELAALERQADEAGFAAARADEALLQHRTPATIAAAARAEAALESLATAQQPELTAVEAVIGTSATAAAGTVQTAAHVVKTHRTRASKAVAFAEKQLGKPYAYAGSGLRSYDCSGLTMRAYETVKKSIGGHSATAQYRKARAQHRLHAYSHARPGDLIFYGSTWSVYHVAIYVGHGRMIEAPCPGKAVREVAVRPWGRLAQVARPTS